MGPLEMTSSAAKLVIEVRKHISPTGNLEKSNAYIWDALKILEETKEVVKSTKGHFGVNHLALDRVFGVGHCSILQAPSKLATEFPCIKRC